MDDRPGHADACKNERKEREELAQLVGEMATDVRAVRDEIGEEPRTMSTNPEEKAGRGLKAILYNMRSESNLRLDGLARDVTEIKQQLPAAVSQRWKTRLISWGAFSGAVIAITGMFAGCYSLARSAQQIATSMQHVVKVP